MLLVFCRFDSRLKLWILGPVMRWFQEPIQTRVLCFFCSKNLTLFFLLCLPYNHYSINCHTYALIDGGTNGYTAHRSFNGSTDMGNTVDEGNWNSLFCSFTAWLMLVICCDWFYDDIRLNSCLKNVLHWMVWNAIYNYTLDIFLFLKRYARL